MADQSGSPRIQQLFESTLQTYHEKTGITLAQHPLAEKLQSFHTVQDVITLLRGQAQAFNDSQRDRIINSINATLSILTPLSATASFTDAFGLVRRVMPMECFTSLTVFFLADSYERNTGWSRYPT